MVFPDGINMNLGWLREVFSDAPTSIIFFSFILSIINLVDTVFRIFFSYVKGIPYPLGLFLRPIVFILQSVLCINFLDKARDSDTATSNKEFKGLLEIQLIFVIFTLSLFVLYSLLDFGKLGYLVFYFDMLWLFVYTIIPFTALWFGITLIKMGRRKLATIPFFFISFSFLSAIPDKIFFWTQNVFGITIPESLAYVGSYGPHIFMFLAVFSTLVGLIYKNKTFPLYLISLVAVTILPVVMEFYREGLINMIIKSVFYWGLGYKGYGWFSVGVFLASFVAYILSIKNLKSRYAQYGSSMLLLLGTMSLPFNGVMLLFQGFSSIPGNVLSLDSIILGFLIKESNRKL
ncbi:MAG: hypothetical protein ACE5KD_01580 [Candidatus Bathyarchaeia archaeon]